MRNNQPGSFFSLCCKKLLVLYLLPLYNRNELCEGEKTRFIDKLSRFNILHFVPSRRIGFGVCPVFSIIEHKPPFIFGIMTGKPKAVRV